MNKKDEFLTKLAALMREYEVHFSTQMGSWDIVGPHKDYLDYIYGEVWGGENIPPEKIESFIGET